MTLRTTGERGAVAVGVSATREAERASDRDGLSLAMNCAVVKRSPKPEKFVVADLDLQQHEALNGIIFNSENFRSV